MNKIVKLPALQLIAWLLVAGNLVPAYGHSAGLPLAPDSAMLLVVG